MKKIEFLCLFFFFSGMVFQSVHFSQNCNHQYRETLVLTKTNPTVEKNDKYTAPGMNFQCYTVYNIDVTAFPEGGTLIIRINNGDGCMGSFDLFPGGYPLPVEGGPEGTLAGDYDVGGKGEIEYKFETGQVFQFCATGSWFAEKGCKNSYSFVASVDFKYGNKNEGSITVSPGNPVGNGSGSFIAPGMYLQAYSLTTINVSAFSSGILKIFIKLGNGESSGSFDLFPEGVPIPTEGRPEGTVAGAYDVSPGSEAYIEYEFARGQVYNFGATGGWFSKKGLKNTYTFKVEVLRK
ncbi:MAG: hypothetical protein V1720_20140 [bacterium]